MSHIGAATTPGRRYAGLNQDVSMYATLESATRSSRPPTRLLVVCDGHGLLGREIAQIAATTLKEELEKAWYDGSKMGDDIILSIFQKAQEQCLAIYDDLPPTCQYIVNDEVKTFFLTLERYGQPGYIHGDVWHPAESGTTATAVLVLGDNDSVVVANAGDSDAYTLTFTEGSGLNNETQLVRVSVPHNATCESEVARIISGGSLTIDFAEGGYLTLKESPFKKGTHVYQYLLNMTRALGQQLLHDHGVIATPDITRFPITEKDVAVVVASDGLWDNIDLDDVAYTLRTEDDPQTAADSLIEQIDLLANMGGDVDNTTVLIAHLTEL